MTGGRRLGYDAARLELRAAQRDAVAASSLARLARAEAARVQADRMAARADADAVATARLALRDAQREAKAATARVRAARARLSAERIALTAGGPGPLERLRTRHDAVLARWMQYETDPAKLLAYPAMSDGRRPETAAFFAALQTARDARPREGGLRLTAADYGLYRDAVERLEQAFSRAERTVRGPVAAPDTPEALRDAARAVMERTTDVLNRTSDALGSWGGRLRPPQDRDDRR